MQFRGEYMLQGFLHCMHVHEFFFRLGHGGEIEQGFKLIVKSYVYLFGVEQYAVAIKNNTPQIFKLG
jgi:hypothetical protein